MRCMHVCVCVVYNCYELLVVPIYACMQMYIYANMFADVFLPACKYMHANGKFMYTKDVCMQMYV